MPSDARVYSLPRWRLTRWLVDADPGVPVDVRTALVRGLFGTLPIYAGGVFNTILVSAAIAIRIQTAPFVSWVILEFAVCIVRLIVLLHARRAALVGGKTWTDIYLVLGLAWSASVGYGVGISMASGDWVAASLACLSAAAMVGGICFRNFSAPRLAGAMILLSLGPTLPGAVFGGEPLLYIAFIQVPMYMIAMTLAAFKLNKMLVTTMRAERENDHRARHDQLTGLANRSGLLDAVDARLATARNGDKALALLFIDLDGFKAVNDTYGHAAGDRLLRHVGSRLGDTVRASDVVARIGGDEFVVLTETAGHEPAVEFGERLIRKLAVAYDLGDGVVARVGVSVGIAMAPAHGTELTDLLAAADAALYEAKSSGKSRCCVASPRTAAGATRRRQGARDADGGAAKDVAA